MIKILHERNILPTRKERKKDKNRKKMIALPKLRAFKSIHQNILWRRLLSNEK